MRCEGTWGVVGSFTRCAGICVPRRGVIGLRVHWHLFQTMALAAVMCLVATASAQAADVSSAILNTRTSGAQASGSAPGLANVAILDVVMLVDESGTERPGKVTAEKQTVGTIVQS